jgi:RNA polymerase sigma-70 factor (ECF subfamily)
VVRPVSEVPDIQDLADGPETQVMQVELAGRMATLLGLLPDKQREIIRLRVVVGYPQSRPPRSWARLLVRSG